MKFDLNITESQTKFIAIRENEYENVGLRAQGPYVPLTLVEDTLIIDYVSKNSLHPDIIAAICITAFYPFIKYSATMPFPVSQKFADSLKMNLLPQHDKIDGVYKAVKEITITNIDINLSPYSNGTNTVIAYGGGIDSTSIALLFPDFPLIHTNCNEKNAITQFIGENVKNKSFLIYSNCKELCIPKGFTTFTNIFLVPLMLSADLNIKNICCGEIIEASCLSNGLKYFPQFNPERRNRWFRFYNNIGINTFSPTAGCSELITSKIIVKHKLEDKVLYCELDNGYPCHKCTKCFRKILELKLHGYSYDMNKFNENLITTFLKKRPLYASNTFIETIKNIEDIPLYIKESIHDIIDVKTDLFLKIYSKSFNYFPVDIKDRLINELVKYADIMTEEEEKYLESWDMVTVKSYS